MLKLAVFKTFRHVSVTKAIVIRIEAGPELTTAIHVQSFTFFLYIEIFLFVKISKVFIYLTVRNKNL